VPSVGENDHFTMHVTMAFAAVDGAMKMVCARLVGREFYGHGLAGRQFLIYVEVRNADSVYHIFACDLEAHFFTFLHDDVGRIELESAGFDFNGPDTIAQRAAWRQIMVCAGLVSARMRVFA
jgi:hypothetical protein